MNVFKIIQDSTKEVLEACKGKDLIIVTHSQLGATEAKFLGIPTINVTLQTEMIAEKLKKQSLVRKFVSNLISAQIAKPYNKIRKVYGLSPIRSSDEIMSQKLNLIPISKYIKQPNPYWEKPLKSKHLSEKSVIEAIEKMKASYDEKKKAAEEISLKVRSEGGLEKAVQLIKEL